jgi:hypothetical protein
VVESAPEPVDINNAEVGHIIVWSATTNGTFLGGSSFSVEPTAGKGPFYFADGNIVANLTAGGVYDAEATETTANGVAQFVELEPGDYTMNITHEGRTCTAGYGIPGGDNALTFTIEADRISYVLFTCDGEEPFQAGVNVTDYATTAAIEGATVCNEEMGLCAQTDANGTANVPYVRNKNNTLTLAKENYFSARIGYTATDVLTNNFITGINQVGLTLIERAQVDVIVPQAPGAPMVDDTKAGIVATVFDRSGETVAGASVSLDPESGVGPFYFAEGNLLANAGAGEAFDSDATGTTANGVLTFVNVDPGTYTLNFSHETKTCVPGAGFETAGDALTLVTAATELIYFSLFCFDLTGLQPSRILVIDGFTNRPIEGATVCPMSGVEDAECYTTDANGFADLMYEPNVDHVARASAEGYLPARQSYNVTPFADGTIPDLVTQLFPPSGIANLVVQAEGVDAVDDTKGHALIWAGDGNGGFLSGVTFTVEPISGVGPVYIAEGDFIQNSFAGNAYDASATATSSNGTANLINVDAGSYTLTATHESATCIAFSGIQNEDGTIGFDIAVGELSYIGLVCTEGQ